jgi:membrane associated rhomboid family serine protease
MNRTFSDGARRLWSGYQPLTNTLIAAAVLFFLGDFIFASGGRAALPLSTWFSFSAPEHWLQPWRLLTYPLVTWGSIIGLIFDGFLLWMVGGSLERSWGTKTLAVFYLALSVVRL